MLLLSPPLVPLAEIRSIVTISDLYKDIASCRYRQEVGASKALHRHPLPIVPRPSTHGGIPLLIGAQDSSQELWALDLLAQLDKFGEYCKSMFTPSSLHLGLSR